MAPRLPCRTSRRGLLLGVASILLFSGIGLLLANKAIFRAIFNSQLVLSPSSGSFPMWHTLPEPLLASMYLFRVTNPDAISTGAKPELEQVGPYVFTEQHQKASIVWSPDNGTVTYRQIRSWHFLPALSNGSLEDQVTILNPVAASLGATIRQKVPGFWIPGLNGVLLAIKEKLFVTKSVREIFFDGYDDPVLTDLEDISLRFPFIKPFIPPGITEKFAFFYQRNGSDFTDGVFNMFTGSKDVSKMGDVFSWNYSTRGLFPGACGEVHGSAGEFYGPDLQPTHIDLFSNDLCRTVRLQYKREVKVLGINSFEFVADSSFFANGTENPANSCYEPPDEILRSGVYNTSLCRFGAPVFISQPHFLQADPYYSSLVHGLAPDPALHGTHFSVEPRSGVPTDVVARFQMNLLLEPVAGITILKDVPTAFFPVMWFENKAGVPADLAFEMMLLANLPEILAGMGWGEVGLAVSIGVIMAVYALTRRKNEDDISPILNQSLVEESAEESVTTGQDGD